MNSSEHNVIIVILKLNYGDSDMTWMQLEQKQVVSPENT